MKSQEILELLKQFKWGTLQRMYGSAHSSIIGFISTEWVNMAEEHSILDGAPSSIIGQGRAGQKIADIILCKGHNPSIVVEVETDVHKYGEKITSLSQYLNNKTDFYGVEFGLLVMTNGYVSKDVRKNGHVYRKSQHNWTPFKEKIIRGGGSETVAFISIEKAEMGISNSVLRQLRARNDYSSWDITNIDCWVYVPGEGPIGDYNLWSQRVLSNV